MIIKNNFFRIPLTFTVKSVDSNIENAVKNLNKGYVCVVDINVLASTYYDENYFKIIKGATFNTCDGSFIAFLLNIKYGKKYYSYNGPEIFKKFIVKNNFKQLLIGPSERDFELLKKSMNRNNHLSNLFVPFVTVDKFNYDEISSKINKIKPDLIWVMLGAPKQEEFIQRLIPKLDKGLLFGTGAALNFYFNRIKNRKFSILGLRFIWLERIFLEPKKQINRILKFIKVLPKIIRDA